MECAVRCWSDGHRRKAELAALTAAASRRRGLKTKRPRLMRPLSLEEQGSGPPTAPQKPNQIEAGASLI
jgi:hypothetical protein